VRKLSVALFFAFVAATPKVFGDWDAISAQAEPSPVRGLEHRYVVLENSATGERVSLELALFSVKSCRLRVIDQPTEPRADLEEVMLREKCLAGVNGGYFDPDYRPIGLLTVDGKTIAPLQRARLLTGVLSAVPGKVQILRVGEFARQQKADAAVECGPMIIDLGKAVHGLESTRPARRTFAAVATGERAALGFCSDVTLADLATILALPFASDFKIQRALNLDGGSSSAFWFKRRNGSAFSISEEKNVRDFVAIVPK
jgi:Phosphodiester glycosidase